MITTETICEAISLEWGAAHEAAPEDRYAQWTTVRGYLAGMFTLAHVTEMGAPEIALLLSEIHLLINIADDHRFPVISRSKK
jgi:hypothetical protein